MAAEVGRGAVQLEPVGMNTDEIYHILRQRLFETLPDHANILEIAKAYSQSVRDAKQMDITNASLKSLFRKSKSPILSILGFVICMQGFDRI